MKLSQRIEKLVNEITKGSQNAFSKRIGVANSTLTSQLKAENFNSSVLSAILSSFPALSAEWLLRGEGEMFLTTTTSQSAMATGDNSTAVLNGNATVTAGNEEKIKYLEQLLEEKERTIHILMTK